MTSPIPTDPITAYRTPAGREIPVEATSGGTADPMQSAGFARRFIHHLRTERAPLRWLVSRVLYRTGLGSWLRFSRGSYKLRFFPTSMTLSAWDDENAYRDDERFIATVLGTGDTVVDVGANVGFVALPAAVLVGSAGRVFAVEPHPRTFAYLAANIRANRLTNVSAFNVAVGNAEGELHFSSIALHDNNNRVVQGGGVRVRATTLDRLLEAHQGPIRLLKIDVEGFEKFVLEGAPATLARTEIVYIEIAEYNFRSNGYTTRELLQILVDAGFSLHAVGADYSLSPVTVDFLPETWANVVARRA